MSKMETQNKNTQGQENHQFQSIIKKDIFYQCMYFFKTRNTIKVYLKMQLMGLWQKWT